MTCLIAVERSTGSIDRLYAAASRLRDCEQVCLVTVIPSGRAAEVEAGQRVLREAARELHRLDGRLSITARLEIGEVAERVTQIAEEIDARLIVMAAHGDGDFPYLTGRGRVAQATLARSRRPVLLVRPAGAELHRPRRTGRRSRAVASSTPPAAHAWGRASGSRC